MALIHASQLNPTGSYVITGSLDVYGQSTFYQTTMSQSALIVSGTMEIVQTQIQAELQKARLTIENLGSLGDKSDNQTIDLGGFF
jgi:hypothetical protein